MELRSRWKRGVYIFIVAPILGVLSQHNRLGVTPCICTDLFIPGNSEFWLPRMC